MYTVIGSPNTRALRVYWALEELQLDYEFIPAEPHSTWAKATNLSGKVPSLRTSEGFNISDSVAILNYLSGKHGNEHSVFSFPMGTTERAEQDSITQFCCDDIDGPLSMYQKNAVFHPSSLKLPEIRSIANYEFAKGLAVLEKRISGKEFLLGDFFSVPDIICGHCAGWAISLGFSIPQSNEVSDYLKRVRRRKALKIAIERTRAK